MAIRVILGVAAQTLLAVACSMTPATLLTRSCCKYGTRWRVGVGQRLDRGVRLGDSTVDRHDG